jgi:ABC-type transport system involved in multi-copper enzyme maturation permease subunit
MKRTVAQALLFDAYSQVMDNKVFRLLVLTVITLIAPTFLIGFHPEGISLLFGWKSFTYKEFYNSFGVPMPAYKDLQVAVIQGLQGLIVQVLAGSFGILFCIAATAFFVPRMLERGAADTLFTKPLSRAVLLVSRYFAGLIFVGILAFLLVLGIHLGLLLVSGYSDPGFLWSALTLVYVYALVQTVSILVGVFTRSSVASILCTILFFTLNGCVHTVWVRSEYGREQLRAAEADEHGDVPASLKQAQPILVILSRVLDTLHYTLPKTHDADVVTKKLRTIVAQPSTALRDEGAKLAVDRDPEGLTRDPRAPTLDLLQSPAVWTSKRPDGTESGRMTLSRRSRLVERPPPAGHKDEKPRTTRQSANQAANEFLKTLEGRPGVSAPPVKDHRSAGTLSFEVVSWTESEAAGTFARERLFCGVEDWMYEIDVMARVDSGDDLVREMRLSRFLEGLHVDQDDAQFLDISSWYELRFGWAAPLKFNAFFSIFSSIAFAVLMLVIAIGRLGRIDF